eukprot:TRINITY_DN50996_c0_g1_i1.p1 TRINITY_DN50996_c0_g1~~TRINITY_DN50996_c0_g1_i1.p1  ORF type:complete len:299 (+),score=40.87 TRINITY_DN50996_c0_g1_i1:77-898(+)
MAPVMPQEPRLPAAPADANEMDQALFWLGLTKRVAVFTGAGISVPSGIPDFRGERGLWTRYDPNVCVNIDVFKKNPVPFWKMSLECEALMCKARPNAAHIALAELESLVRGRVDVITQNIDSLHQTAGTSQVFELHGNTRGGRCLHCQRSFSPAELQHLVQVSVPPRCSACNSSQVKTNVVMFGEMLPSNDLAAARAVVQQCDLLFVVGSALQVAPAHFLPIIAKTQGARVVFINKTATQLDAAADVIIRGAAEKVLPALVQRLRMLDLPLID